MVNWHGYFGIENLNLNDSQRDTLVAALRALGPASHPQPACLCHWRTRLDGQAAIFEALFDEDHLAVDAFRQRLGTIFGVSWVTIGYDVSQQTFATLPTPIVVFSRLGVDYLRVALFGGVGAEWMASGDECRAYLKLYAAQWEPE